MPPPPPSLSPPPPTPPVITVTTFLPGDTAQCYCRRSGRTSSCGHVSIAIKCRGQASNRAAFLSGIPGISLSCSTDFQRSCPVMRERASYLRCLFLCVLWRTRRWSIIEWFCEGSMRLGIVFTPLSLWISAPFVSASRNSIYRTHL